jgi:hypothetical protein
MVLLAPASYALKKDTSSEKSKVNVVYDQYQTI